MPNHIRTQLREAISDALTTALGTAYTVKPRRVRPIEGSKLPLVSIFAPGDEVTRESPDEDFDDPVTIERTVDIRITVYRAGHEDMLDDDLDEDARKIEAGLAFGVVVDSKRVMLDYRGCAVDAEGADKNYGTIQLRYFVELINQANTPDDLVA